MTVTTPLRTRTSLGNQPAQDSVTHESGFQPPHHLCDWAG